MICATLVGRMNFKTGSRSGLSRELVAKRFCCDRLYNLGERHSFKIRTFEIDGLNRDERIVLMPTNQHRRYCRAYTTERCGHQKDLLEQASAIG
jgi:hypothetical protein